MACPSSVAVTQHHWYSYMLSGTLYYSDAVVTAVGGGTVNMTVLPSGFPSFDVSNVSYGCFMDGYWTCHIPGPGCTINPILR